MTKRRELDVSRCLKKESIKSITKLINCWQQKDEFACLYFYLKHQINNNIVSCWQHRVGCLYFYFKNKSIKSITILINCWQQIDERWMFEGAWGEPAEYAEVPGHDPAVQPPPGWGAEGQVRLIKMKNSNGRQRLYNKFLLYSTSDYMLQKHLNF